jgi:hypothetical protein
MSVDHGGGNVNSAMTEANGMGEWITPPVSYIDPTRRFCKFCGRPIARRFWLAKTERGGGTFCGPAHAALFTTYPRSSDE